MVIYPITTDQKYVCELFATKGEEDQTASFEGQTSSLTYHNY